MLEELAPQPMDRMIGSVHVLPPSWQMHHMDVVLVAVKASAKWPPTWTTISSISPLVSSNSMESFALFRDAVPLHCLSLVLARPLAPTHSFPWQAKPLFLECGTCLFRLQCSIDGPLFGYFYVIGAILTKLRYMPNICSIEYIDLHKVAPEWLSVGPNVPLITNSIVTIQLNGVVC